MCMAADSQVPELNFQHQPGYAKSGLNSPFNLFAGPDIFKNAFVGQSAAFSIDLPVRSGRMLQPSAASRVGDSQGHMDHMPRPADGEMAASVEFLRYLTDREKRVGGARHEPTDSCSGNKTFTEVLLLNVSAKCSRSKLQATLESAGFRGLYDNLFLPKAEFGKSWVDATISFLSAAPAQAFYQKFNMANIRAVSYWKPLRVKLPDDLNTQSSGTALGDTLSPYPAAMPSGSRSAAFTSLKRTNNPSVQITTLMMRHVPLRCSQETLLNEIVAAGFGGSFDFFYMPMESKGPRNRAIAFINLATEDVALSFYEFFHGQSLIAFPAHRPLMILPGDTQGYEANWQLFQSSVLESGLRSFDFPSIPLFLRHAAGHQNAWLDGVEMRL